METLTDGRVAVSGWQTIPVTMVALGLTAADGLSQVWFVDAAGRLTGGAEATNRSLAYCPWVRPLTWLYRLPGLRQLENRAYAWVARHRHSLPGGTAACEVGETGRQAGSGDPSSNRPGRPLSPLFLGF